MLLGFIGDLHIGARGGSPHARKFIKSYFLDYLFPKFKELGVQQYIQTGDAFDVRKSMHGLDMDFILNDFIPAHEQYGLEGYYLTGNHDITFRDTNRVSWVKVLEQLSEGHIISFREATDFVIGGIRICMVPWINRENIEHTMEVIESSTAEYAVGHLELSGFPMYRNSICEEGQIDLSALRKFKSVKSGHFHTKSSDGNVEYVGTPYHLTWQDFPDGNNRGFHTLDTETHEWKFYPNPVELSLFRVFVYDWKRYDEDTTLKLKLKDPTILEKEFGLKGSIVKIIVESRDNAKHYADFCSALRKVDLIDYVVVDKTETKSVMSTNSDGSPTEQPLIDESMLQADILQILEGRIKNTEGIDKDLTTQITRDVHGRAMTMEKSV